MDTYCYTVSCKHFLSRKRFIFQLFFYFVLLATGILLVFKIGKLREGEMSAEKIFEGAVGWKFLTLSGSYVSFPDNNPHPCLLLLFDPECDHCIEEIKEIRSDTLLYKQVEIFLVSLSEKRETDNIVNLLHMANFKHIHIVLLEDKTRASLPQHIMLPTLLLFNEKSKLCRIIEGETNVTLILSYLKH